MAAAASGRGVGQMRSEVEVLLADLDRTVRDNGALIQHAHPAHRADAENLLHYVALRQRDVRHLQRALADRGLSSLGRCEPHVLASVRAVHRVLAGGGQVEEPDTAGFERGRAALDVNTDALFGGRPEHRVTRIMVTLPSEAATSYALVRALGERGMDVARINAAHDGPPQWRAMAGHVRKAGEELGRSILVSLDLPGPKLRTGPLAEGPRVLRLHPGRDLRGVAAEPAQVRLVADLPRAAAAVSPAATPALPVAGDWLARRRVGERVSLEDTRGAHRSLEIVSSAPGECAAVVWDTTYVETGTVLAVDADTTVVAELPPVEQYHLLRPGDSLILTTDLTPAEPWRPGAPGEARIGCSLPVLVTAAEVGDRVLLDDGKIATVVERTGATECRLRVLVAASTGSKLRAEKGVNVPDTALPIPMLSAPDEEALAVAVHVADMVAVSFLRSEADVDVVQDRMSALGRPDLGLVLKIETQAAFHRLPAILLHGLRSARLGVMIARGDLAVEVGYERLAELQEEILWLSEAAHLPVIWATEVLDRLARTGRPSRAEVTDAAMSQRAECVMLNKGPYVDTAITVLDHILRRMAGHQRKKTPLLRPLLSWMPE